MEECFKKKRHGLFLVPSLSPTAATIESFEEKATESRLCSFELSMVLAPTPDCGLLTLSKFNGMTAF